MWFTHHILLKFTDEIISWYTQYCTTVITVRFSLTTRWLLCTLSWSPETTLHMQGPRSKEAHVIFVLFRPNTSVYTCFASFFSPISLCSSSSSRHLLIPWNTVEHQGSKLHNYPLYGFHHFSPPTIFHLHASQSTALSTDCKQLMYTNWQLIMQQSYSTTVTVDAAVNVAAHGQMKVLITV